MYTGTFTYTYSAADVTLIPRFEKSETYLTNYE